MRAAPARDWNVFKPMFADHWPAFQPAHPRDQRAYDDDLVATRLACGPPDKMGYLAYRCLHGGQGKPLVSMRGQSALCWRGAKGSVEHGVSQVRPMLHEGVISRHIILTVPAMLRTTCSQNAAVV